MLLRICHSWTNFLEVDILFALSYDIIPQWYDIANKSSWVLVHITTVEITTVLDMENDDQEVMSYVKIKIEFLNHEESSKRKEGISTILTNMIFLKLFRTKPAQHHSLQY